MAEVFGSTGQAVERSGTYACSQCGHREHFERGASFPADHHDGHPWTMMVADDKSDSEPPKDEHSL